MSLLLFHFIQLSVICFRQLKQMNSTCHLTCITPDKSNYVRPSKEILGFKRSTLRDTLCFIFLQINGWIIYNSMLAALFLVNKYYSYTLTEVTKSSLLLVLDANLLTYPSQILVIDGNLPCNIKTCSIFYPHSSYQRLDCK